MIFCDYLKDKLLVIIFNIFCMILLSIYLIILNNSFDAVLLIDIVWCLVVILFLEIDYYKRKKYFEEILKMLDELEEKFLISDIILKPQKLEDEIYGKILRSCNKAMLEKITQIKHERKEYKEYIEQWIHEIKIPLSALKLICENNKNDVTKKILFELERTNKYIEQALFYARSENVEKDYLIREFSLEEIVNKAISENKTFLIGNRVSVKVECNHNVYTDNKWIIFILSQIITNSVKYGAKNLKIYSCKNDGKVELCVNDNGVGISEADLPRIFEKGFTGNNGHTNQKSTGIGLYLCKKLCDKIEVEIEVSSKQGEFTEVRLIF